MPTPAETILTRNDRLRAIREAAKPHTNGKHKANTDGGTLMGRALTGDALTDAIMRERAASRKRVLPVGGKAEPPADVDEEPGESSGDDSRDSRVRRDSRVSGDGVGVGVIGELRDYFADYVALPRPSLLVISAWVAAAWLVDLWDRFPHLAVTSPQKRCGKSRLLELLLQVCPNAKFAVSISGPALYRSIGTKRPTLLLDEAQSLSRRGSESTEVLNEIFCGGISKDAVVTRCVGDKHTPTDFPIYCPKVVALIGKLAGALGDRSIPILMKRKTRADVLKKARMREIEDEGKSLAARIAEWAEASRDAVAAVYAELTPFDIENDRTAELLLPLMAVVSVAAPDTMDELEAFATGLEEAEREFELADPSMRLLSACRELLAKREFIPTDQLIIALLMRKEEGWDEFNKGRPINAEKVAALLREYDIRPSRNANQTARGYHRADFRDAWARYLTAPP